MTSILPNPPSLIEFGDMRFLIFDAPNDDNLNLYMDELRKYSVHHVVRVCDPTYERQTLEKNGFDVKELSFADGGAPPDSIIENWMQLVSSAFPDGKNKNRETIGVHCVAGLGRAPVLVAVALIESGMEPLQAVEFIRSKRKGSINVTQLQYIRNYKRRFRKRPCCGIM